MGDYASSFDALRDLQTAQNRCEDSSSVSSASEPALPRCEASNSPPIMASPRGALDPEPGMSTFSGPSLLLRTAWTGPILHHGAQNAESQSDCNNQPVDYPSSSACFHF
eukprot:scaffold85033_cov31-Prasinocladus_malaysianus.AAC.2